MNSASRGVSITLLVLSAMISLAMVVLGFVRELDQPGAGAIVVYVGALGLIITACSGAVVLSMEKTTENEQDAVVSALGDVKRSVERMSQQSALSDDARRVLNRSKERELLCRAIEEDIRKHDWEAALVLCEELSNRFGYGQEADRFRSQIEMGRAEGLDEEISDAMARVDALIVQRRWDDAHAAARQVADAFPAMPRMRALGERVERAKAQYKGDVERRFLMLAQSDRVDEAMELLKELDAYLTEDEAEPLREVARGVIGKARENLGAAFKIAYQDREWGIAASVGEQILAQFPNSRMAEEVNGMMGDLRERASQV
ncbi:MAG: hypothetical protein AAF937_06035 [Planctomycetota bacterium]